MLFCYSKKSSVPSSVPSSVSSVPSVPSVVQKLRSELPMSSMPFKSGDRILFQGYATLLLSGLSFVAVIFTALPALFVTECLR